LGTRTDLVFLVAYPETGRYVVKDLSGGVESSYQEVLEGAALLSEPLRQAY
jgi:hypothetical protein